MEVGPVGGQMHGHVQQRQSLPVRLTHAERNFYAELRRLVDTAGLSFRALEESTSAARSDSGDPAFYSKSQWGRWLNGQSQPPRKAIRKLAEKLAKEDIEASHLADLWDRAFVPASYLQETGAPSKVGLPGNSRFSGRIRAPLRVTVSADVPQQLPAGICGFAGRSVELHKLTALLDDISSAGTMVISAVDGMPGIGKTAMAVHWAHQVATGSPMVSCISICAALIRVACRCVPAKRSAVSWTRSAYPPARSPGAWMLRLACIAACWPAVGCWWCWITPVTRSRSARFCQGVRAA